MDQRMTTLLRERAATAERRSNPIIVAPLEGPDLTTIAFWTTLLSTTKVRVYPGYEGIDGKCYVRVPGTGSYTDVTISGPCYIILRDSRNSPGTPSLVTSATPPQISSYYYEWLICRIEGFPLRITHRGIANKEVIKIT